MPLLYEVRSREDWKSGSYVGVFGHQKMDISVTPRGIKIVDAIHQVSLGYAPTCAVLLRERGGGLPERCNPIVGHP